MSTVPGKETFGLTSLPPIISKKRLMARRQGTGLVLSLSTILRRQFFQVFALVSTSFSSLGLIKTFIVFLMIFSR